MVALVVNGETADVAGNGLPETWGGYPIAYFLTDGPGGDLSCFYYCAFCARDLADRDGDEPEYLHSEVMTDGRSTGYACDRCLQYLPGGEPFCIDCGSDNAPVRSADGDCAYCRACAVRAGLLTLAGAIAANDADTDYVNARWARGESVRDLLDTLDRERWDLLDLADETDGGRV